MSSDDHGTSKSPEQPASGPEQPASARKAAPSSQVQPFDATQSDLGRPPDERAAAPQLGQVGPYHIISVISEGGMGIVYKAERTPIHQIVALKMILLGMDTREVVARFETERQALAVMDHPNIAKVFDGGATETGRPYFVMEYVPGEPITNYCDRHNLTTRHRLELFSQVCDAINHAHLKGVIHRDIKPSNVLVCVPEGATHPVVKVIDFGVAKATGGVAAQKAYFTEHGRMIGTLEYMSPEQAEMTRLDVDTRTDVYSLGVLLYELLTGALPFDRTSLLSRGYDEIRRVIREEDPPAPSTRLTTLGDAAKQVARKRQTASATLARELKRELEWIPLMAMRKDRTRRYQSAQDLGRDVLNYLDGRPLSAGPESGAYRAKKFVTKHRFGFATTATFVVLLISGVVATAVQAVRATRAERLAVRNRDEAIDTIRELLDRVANEKLFNVPGLQETRNQLIGSALVRFASVAGATASEDPTLKLSIGRLYHVAAVGLADTGKTDAAIQHARQSIALLTAWHDSASAPEAESELARAHSVLGDLLRRTRQLPAARTEINTALDIRRKLATNNPAPTQRAALAEATINLAGLEYDSGNLPAALTHFEQAAEMLRAVYKELGGAPAADRYLLSLLAVSQNLASVYFDAGSLDKSLAASDEVLAIQLERMQWFPHSALERRSVAKTYLDRTRVLTRAGKFDQAIHSCESAVEHGRVLANENPDVVDDVLFLVESLAWQTQLLMQVGRADDARAAMQRCGEIVRAAIPRLNNDVDRDKIATSLANLAWLQLIGGQANDSVVTAREGIKQSAGNALCRLNLAHALLLTNRFDEAMALYTRVVRVSPGEPSLRSNLIDDFTTLRAMGLAHADMQRVEQRLQLGSPQPTTAPSNQP